jgi:hypothetical protein
MTAKINIVICVRGVWSSNLAANQLSRLMLSLSGQIHFRCVIWVSVNSVTKVVAMDVVSGVGVSCSFLYSSSMVCRHTLQLFCGVLGKELLFLRVTFFIYRLYNFSFDNFGCVGSNDWLNSEWFGRDMEWIERHMSCPWFYTEEPRGKTREVRLVGLQAKIPAHDLPDTKQEC